MSKTPRKAEPQKPVSKAEREARKALRQVSTPKRQRPSTRSRKRRSQKIRERLKAEQLEREAAAPPPAKATQGEEMTAPSPVKRRWTSEEEQKLD